MSNAVREQHPRVTAAFDNLVGLRKAGQCTDEDVVFGILELAKLLERELAEKSLSLSDSVTQARRDIQPMLDVQDARIQELERRHDTTMESLSAVARDRDAWCATCREVEDERDQLRTYAEALKAAADERLVTLLRDAAFALSKAQPSNMLVDAMDRAATKLSEAHKAVAALSKNTITVPETVATQGTGTVAAGAECNCPIPTHLHDVGCPRFDPAVGNATVPAESCEHERLQSQIPGTTDMCFKCGAELPGVWNPVLPPEVREAMECIDRTYARRWHKGDPPGYVGGNVPAQHLGTVLDFVRDLMRAAVHSQCNAAQRALLERIDLRTGLPPDELIDRWIAQLATDRTGYSISEMRTLYLALIDALAVHVERNSEDT